MERKDATSYDKYSPSYIVMINISFFYYFVFFGDFFLLCLFFSESALSVTCFVVYAQCFILPRVTNYF